MRSLPRNLRRHWAPLCLFSTGWAIIISVALGYTGGLAYLGVALLLLSGFLVAFFEHAVPKEPPNRPTTTPPDVPSPPPPGLTLADQLRGGPCTCRDCEAYRAMIKEDVRTGQIPPEVERLPASLKVPCDGSLHCDGRPCGVMTRDQRFHVGGLTVTTVDPRGD